MVKKRQRGPKKSKPTGAKRKKVQSVDDRYAHAREDAQLLGRIPTTPEEALKPERINPSSQKEQALPQLIERAIRRGWATPEERKPGLVDELIEIVHDEEARHFDKVAAYGALLKGDQFQYEQDHPEEAGKAKGGVKVSVNNQNEVTVVDLGELFKRVDEQRNGGVYETRAVQGQSQLPISETGEEERRV